VPNIIDNGMKSTDSGAKLRGVIVRSGRCKRSRSRHSSSSFGQIGVELGIVTLEGGQSLIQNFNPSE
jgi:hypothetical protein